MPSERKIFEADRRAARERFRKVRIAEREYQSQLGAVGRNIGSIVKGFAAKGRILDQTALLESLEAYSKLLRPWAEAVADRMIRDVGQRDLNAWRQLTKAIGSTLYRDLYDAPVGLAHAQLLAEQVHLITSLPRDAAQRVHELTRQARVSGKRAEELAKEIEQSGHVSIDRARLIARTEVGRTASALVEVRATYVGSEGYFWRGIMDSDERKEHKALEGRYIKWTEPPIAGKGKGGVPVRYHAGRGPNCRCWPEPVLPDSMFR